MVVVLPNIFFPLHLPPANHFRRQPEEPEVFAGMADVLEMLKVVVIQVIQAGASEGCEVMMNAELASAVADVSLVPDTTTDIPTSHALLPMVTLLIPCNLKGAEPAVD